MPVDVLVCSFAMNLTFNVGPRTTPSPNPTLHPPGMKCSVLQCQIDNLPTHSSFPCLH